MPDLRYDPRINMYRSSRASLRKTARNDRRVLGDENSRSHEGAASSSSGQVMNIALLG